MSDLQDQLRVLKSLADESRLRIIKVILSGPSNPGDIARTMGKHRSTIEKHLRILVASGIVQKMPGLDANGHLQVKYSIRRGQEVVLRDVLLMAEALSKGPSQL